MSKLLYCMSNLLIMEINSQPEAIIGPILDHCFNEEIFLHIHNWATNIPYIYIPRCQVRLYIFFLIINILNIYFIKFRFCYYKYMKK